MKSLNLVQLIGNLGGDPEVTEHQDKMIVKFSLALDEQKNSENTTWQKVVCFNKLAEITAAHLKKGARIYISGKLKTSKWIDKNKENRYTTEVIANELIMLDSKKTASEGAI